MEVDKEYRAEEDLSLKTNIDFFLERANNSDYLYKVIEILNQAASLDAICLYDITRLEKILHFSIRRYILQYSDFYLMDIDEEVRTISDVNKYILKQVSSTPKRKSKYPKITYQIVRNVICNAH